jgi:hypothetical protein
VQDICINPELYQAGRQEGNLADDDVSVQFQRLGKDGNLVADVVTLNSIIVHAAPNDEVEILGINQNLRLVLLERHIRESHADVLLFDPLRHFVGCGPPRRVFADIKKLAPATFHELNEQQQSVAHPLSLMTAMDVAGPRGVERQRPLPSSFAQSWNAQITMLLSSLRGMEPLMLLPINSPASCLTRRSDKVVGITDIPLWMSLMSFGAGSAMGSSTMLFTLDEKIK